MKPYKYGDKIESWKKYDLCPECGERCSEMNKCRCTVNLRECPNGHKWHQENGVIKPGDGHGPPVDENELIGKMAKKVEEDINQKIIKELRKDEIIR